MILKKTDGSEGPRDFKEGQKELRKRSVVSIGDVNWRKSSLTSFLSFTA